MLREIHPGYILPVGVWNVRESIRGLLSSRYRSFETLDEALDYASSFFFIPKASWMKNSELLRQAKEQMKITQYLK